MWRADLKRSLDMSAEAFLNRAKEYHLAAGATFPIYKEADGPVYFLYTHTIELALKAYLRSHGVQLKPIHKLDVLLRECRQHGMIVDRKTDNVINSLSFEYRKQGFRYYVFESHTLPMIEFLKEVADNVMEFVEKEVKLRPTKIGTKEFIVTLKFGKPRPKRSLKQDINK
jgi:HEPN domain-containing protein